MRTQWVGLMVFYFQQSICVVQGREAAIEGQFEKCCFTWVLDGRLPAAVLGRSVLREGGMRANTDWRESRHGRETTVACGRDHYRCLVMIVWLLL